MTSRHILSLQSVMHCHDVSRPTDMTETDYNTRGIGYTEFNFSGLVIRYKLVPPELQVMSNC